MIGTHLLLTITSLTSMHTYAGTGRLEIVKMLLASLLPLYQYYQKNMIAIHSQELHLLGCCSCASSVVRVSKEQKVNRASERTTWQTGSNLPQVRLYSAYKTLYPKGGYNLTVYLQYPRIENTTQVKHSGSSSRPSAADSGSRTQAPREWPPKAIQNKMQTTWRIRWKGVMRIWDIWGYMGMYRV